ncbi:tubulin-specific chaperone D-like [Oppia nitens]|uniref:tubulin-specific chaperone D-like n=1 Tax=Oppia nitens TaxID=1686743 RepID=UPI0023DC9E34|nr:tubulin-specific chaperone D-like [Oppia nitens]
MDMSSMEMSNENQFNANKDNDNDEDNTDLVYSMDTFEEDSRECMKLIGELSSLSGHLSGDSKVNVESRVEHLNERFIYLIDKWQTNPKLIESHVKQFLDSIIAVTTDTQFNGPVFHTCFRFVQRLVACIGPKTIGRYFPTEVVWLPKLIDWCERQSPEDTNSWPTRAAILLWLSMAVKTPFHLRKFDSNSSDDNPNQLTVSDRVYALIDNYLEKTDKSRDSAAILAANFLSRPDIVDQYMSRFVTDCLPHISTNFGYLMSVAVLFKIADRKNIRQFAERVIEIGVKLDTSGDLLMAKWKVKLIGRSTLSLLTPRIAKWRYKRGYRVLTDNITIQIGDEKQPKVKVDEKGDTIDDNEDDSDFSDIPEQIEVIIDSLLNSLHDKNTIVRYSAAKYLARLTNRLPKELATEVVSHVLQLCEWKESDNSWHGCCMALAELSRRGLILPDQLSDIVDVVQRALLFDEVKGSFSIGSNVRDAACYVCWSLSRAYDSQVIQQYVKKLGPTLVCVVCFDREINCRRAASATIQELVGRTQVFPHGLEVLVLTDFHSLSIRSHCYLSIALKLAEKPEFGDFLVEQLVNKCHHWDRDIREIAAQSLGRLSTVIDMNKHFPRLLSMSTSLDLNSRHGSILSIAHIISHCVIADKINAEFIGQMESIAITLTEKNLLRGIGGEFMKQALSVLIEKCSSVLLPINGDQKVFDVWIDVLQHSIDSEDVKTRKDAVTAVPIFCQNYLLNRPELLKKFLDLLTNHLMSVKESARIGVSECLRLMTTDVIDVQYYDQCFDTIVSHIKSDDFMCGSRASEVLTLVTMSQKYLPISEQKKLQIVECLCRALDDRTKDQKGDVGGNVRFAAIEASLLFINEMTDQQIIEILKLLTSQCLSLWKKERNLATNAFKEIVLNRDINQIDRQLIQTFFESSGDERVDEWKPFVQLLNVDTFTYSAWKGLVKCVANPNELYVRNVLKHELKSLNESVFKVFLDLYEENLSVDNLSLCCIKLAHFLLTSYQTSDELRTKLLTITWNCVRRVKDCQKLVAAIDVFCAALQNDESFKQSMSYLVIFLCHAFPRIRVQTANQLYVALLIVDDISEEAVNLLTETDWMQSLDNLRSIRDRICDELSIAKPRRPVNNAK